MVTIAVKHIDILYMNLAPYTWIIEKPAEDLRFVHTLSNLS